MWMNEDTEHLERLQVRRAGGESRLEAMQRTMDAGVGEGGRVRVEPDGTWLDGERYEHSATLAGWLAREGETGEAPDLVVDHERLTIAEPARFGSWKGLGARRFRGAGAEAIVERGEALYRAHHRERCEREAMGHYAAVDVRTGAAEVDPDGAQALMRAREKIPNGIFHLLKVGAAGAHHARG